jgi:hypothetical protein
MLVSEYQLRRIARLDCFRTNLVPIHRMAQGALDAPWAISDSNCRIKTIAAARRVQVVGLKRIIGKSARDPSTLATTITSRPAL